MNIYESNYTASCRQEEFSKASTMWNKSKQNEKNMDNGAVFNTSFKDNNMIQSLTGELINSRDFTHNNQQAFFGSRVRQNTDDKQNSKLETFTGISPFLRNKVEQPCLFAPSENMGNVCGAQSSLDFSQSRMVTSGMKTSLKPFDSVYVGRGLGMGYDDAPSGGFQSFNDQQYALPKTVDDLRLANNPKITYEPPVKAAKATVTNRGYTGKVARDKPELPTEWGIERTNKGHGGPQARADQPLYDVRCTTRPDTHVTYSGIPSVAGKEAGACRQHVEETS